MHESPEPYSPEWDADVPSPEVSTRASRQAAVWLWTQAGLQFLFGSCCGMMMLAMSMFGGQLLEDPATREQLTEQQVEQFEKLSPYFGPSAAIVFVAIVAPAIAYLPLGFGVLRGKRRSVKISRWLVGLQMGLVAYLLLSGAIAAITGQAYGFQSAGLLVWALPMILLVLTFKALGKVNVKAPAGDR